MRGSSAARVGQNGAGDPIRHENAPLGERERSEIISRRLSIRERSIIDSYTRVDRLSTR